MKAIQAMLIVLCTCFVSCGDGNEKSVHDTYMPAPGDDSATVDSNRTNGYAPPNTDTTAAAQ
ncbi:hypothetical protein I5907_18485 [Panacibacter sp. DH6]|uniref:Uncharacterized protein n=1 Tax=Panacibacter microcysteis TaxID=2793269 RepID=A0A931MD83_9BACT|nr:hypothetical protein [Panacibacter microcysteis]MBG9378233.1 hypothetical protein [Panacibacter microcysteis]